MHLLVCEIVILGITYVKNLYFYISNFFNTHCRRRTLAISHPELLGDILGGSPPQPSGQQVRPPIIDEVPPPSAGALPQTTLEKTLRLLPPSKGVYLGAWNQDGVGRKLFEEMVGRRAPIIGGGYDTDCQDRGTEGTKPKIDIACREARFKNGYVSTYTIETYALNEDSDSTSPLPEKVTPQDIIDGKVDAELKEVARAIANFGKPILWLYHREPFLQFGGYGPDGTWPRPLCDRFPQQCNRTALFGTPQKPDGPERYIAVARHIHDLVESEIKRLGKESPIIWVMGALSTGELNYPGFYTEYYPGNVYVNWHAFNWYPMETEGASLNRYQSISKSPGWKEAMTLDPSKPVLILEFGVSSLLGDRNKWFQAFFNDIRTNPAMENLAGFIYWQEEQRYQQGSAIRTRIPKTTAEENAWKEEIQKYPQYWNSALRFTDFTRTRILR